MGIQGLLPLLKSIMVPFHIKDLRGCSVAVDTYSWLHKGALSCSKELCKGEPTSRHIAYCMHRVNLLRHHGVKPILVFDGGLLPMKGEQETKRSRARKENLERAIEHETMGNSAAAYECYQKAVDISPSIAHELIQVLKQENIDYVVAPYEADAQMTFLAVSKHVDAVITEDSDLIPFGCPRIIFKMDKFGQAVQFQYSMLQQNKELNFTGFTKQMVLEMCILSGCDYLPSLPGMGLKKAHALICKFKSYEKVIKHLRYNTASVPPLYEESFKKALWTFQHQPVYDPITEDIVHLSEIHHDLGEDLDFLGPMLSQDIAKDIARGDLDPITKMPFQGKIVLPGVSLERNYKPKEVKSERERKKLELPAQKNVLTNYFCSTSLEAKRKFKVPRIMPKNLGSAEESSPSSDENASEDPTTFTMSHSQGDFSDSSPPLEDSFASDTSQSLESPSYTELRNTSDGSGKPKNSEHSVLLLQPKHALYKPCMTLHKQRQSKLVFDQVEEKTRTGSRKVIVRSSYFQHKLLKENDTENENEKFISENDAANDIFCCKSVSESPSYGSNCTRGAIKKRPSNSPERSQTGFAEVKRARQSESLPRESNDIRDPETKSVEISSDKGNFGCNISHLNHFSDVAEKSMERFISVISSFKCSSSGSRASGLRAPLKDVRNTLGIGVNQKPMDIREFLYVPKNQNISSVSSKD